MKKRWIWLGLVFVLVAYATIFIWPVRENWRQRYLTNKILNEISTLENLYTTDTYGGETPEETLELFLTALRVGNADLASKYFVPEKRKKMKNDIKIGIKNNQIKYLILDLEEEKYKNCYHEDTVCEFSTFDNNETVKFSFLLRKNDKNNKWLIDNL